jgi:hypothetical protein
MAPKQFLNNVTIASPCNADWNAMTGNDQVRFCSHCNLDVHNLSRMSRSQAERLVARSNGGLCVRYHHDAAGRPATLPMRRKLHHIGRRVSRIAAGAFTATLSVTSAAAQGSTSYREVSTSPPVAAQPITRWNLNSSVAGVVTDVNGAVIAGATVFVSNEELNVSFYASTDSTGFFKIEGLQGGIYKVRIEAMGFAAYETEGLYVQANGATRADRSLKVAAVEEVTEVQERERYITMGSMRITRPESPFIRAAQDDDLETLTALISGQDVNLRDRVTGTTALEHAVRNSNLEMVELLLTHGADVNARNSEDQTVLMMLNEDTTTDLVWDLINAGANVKLTDAAGNTALIETASERNPEALKVLLDAGSEVNAKDKSGRTALMAAASEGLVNNVRMLVLAGADINALNAEDNTALGLADENNHTIVVRFLRSKGAAEAVAKLEKEE